MKNVFALYQDHIGSTVGFIDDELRGVIITVGPYGPYWGLVASSTHHENSFKVVASTVDEIMVAFWELVDVMGNSNEAPEGIMKEFVTAHEMLEKERALSVN